MGGDACEAPVVFVRSVPFVRMKPVDETRKQCLINYNTGCAILTGLVDLTDALDVFMLRNVIAERRLLPSN
jgi:hypothetical protein